MIQQMDYCLITVSSGEVTTLKHEILDDAVEDGPLITLSLILDSKFQTYFKYTKCLDV